MIRAFVPDDVPAAAALLVDRHREHCLVSPLLAPLDQATAEVTGYLLARTRDGDWGPNAWIEAAGCAGQRLPELYAYCAGDWVDAGRAAPDDIDTPEAIRAEWEQSWDDGYEVMVAVVDGRVTGYVIGCDVAKSGANAGLVVPRPCGHLATAAVLPAYRGQGLGRALGFVPTFHRMHRHVGY